MEVIVVARILPVDRRIVHAHHVGELESEQAVQHTRRLLERRGKTDPFLFRKLVDRSHMPFGHDVYAVGVLAEKGQENRKVLVLENNPLAGFLFLVEHIAENTAAGLLVVLLGGGKLQFQLLGHKGVAVHLAVGMRHGHADQLAPVFKDENILDLGIGLHGLKPLYPQIHQLGNVFHRQLGQGHRVLGGIEDDLAFPIGRRGLVKCSGHRIGFGRVLRQGGKIVVVFVDVKMVGHLAGARAERAVILGHLGPALPVGGDHDPILGQGMITQFSHKPITLPLPLRPFKRPVPRRDWNRPVIFVRGIEPLAKRSIMLSFYLLPSAYPPTGRIFSTWQAPAPKTSSMARR